MSFIKILNYSLLKIDNIDLKYRLFHLINLFDLEKRNYCKSQILHFIILCIYPIDLDFIIVVQKIT